MRTLIVLLFLFSLILPLGCESVEKPPEGPTEEKENVAVIVNGIEVTEEEVEMYAEEIARDRAEENLSAEEIKELAIGKAIRVVVINDYFEKQGETITEGEIEEGLLLRVEEEPGVETIEEYFEAMAVKGISREEIEREISLVIKIVKLIDLMMEDLEEEDLRDYYEERKEEAEKQGITLRPFEKIEDIADVYATEIVLKALDEHQEKAEIEIME